MTADSNAYLKNACALVKRSTQRSTGFLIQPQQLLTVSFGPLTAQASDDPILLRFRSTQTGATVVCVDQQRKSARLKLDKLLDGVLPLELSSECAHGDTCILYGFPELSAPSGLLLTAVVLDPFGEDLQGEPGLVLQMRGPALPMAGFAGSPVSVNGKVVGLLHSILPDDTGTGAAGGILYATPIRQAMERLESDVPISAHRRVPTSASLRRLIGKVLPNIEDLDAFCHDNFFSIWQRFTPVTSHVVKLTSLLDADRALVLRALERDPSLQLRVRALAADLELEPEYFL